MKVITLFTFTGIFVISYFLKFIAKFDNNNIEINKKRTLICIMLLSIFCYLKYTNFIESIFIFYLLIYLLLSSIIDYSTQNVYSLLNYITFGISVLYLIYKKEQVDVFYIIIIGFIFYIVSLLFTKLKIYGEGDHELLVAILFFLAGQYNYNILQVIFILILLADVIVIIANFSNFNLKKIRFNKQVAFVPSIAIALILLLSVA